MGVRLPLGGFPQCELHVVHSAVWIGVIYDAALALHGSLVPTYGPPQEGNMTTLKIPNVDARLDAFVSYVTDVNPLLTEHQKFFADRHPEGKAFATAVIEAGSGVLQQSAKVTIENEEAKAATQGQNDSIKKARAVVSEVRERGGYIISELSLRDDVKSATDARIVRVACGIGLRGSIASQTGLRRMLVVQQEGQKRAGDIFRAFKQPDLAPQLDEALRALDDAIRQQSKEQSEADTEQGVLEVMVQEAAQLLERAIRLINASGEEAPEGLRRGLLGLEGRHWRVFTDPAAAAGEKPPVRSATPAPVQPVVEPA